MTVNVNSVPTYITYSSHQNSYIITFPYNADPTLISVYTETDNIVRKLISTEYNIEVVPSDPIIFGILTLNPSELPFDRLIIRRETPLSQLNTFYSQTMYGQTTEGSLDKLTYVVQELSDKQVDLLKVSESDTVLGFDADGNITVVKGSESIKIENNEISITGIIPPEEIPIATPESVGGIKPGTGLTTEADGTTSVNFPDPPEPYELPVASASNLGGIKKGTGLTIGSDGTTSVNFPDPPEPYELPVASDSNLGGIKIPSDSGIGVTSGGEVKIQVDDATISIKSPGSLYAKTATANSLGVVKPDGETIVIDNGVISTVVPDPPEPYELPVASDTILGGIKKGTGLTIGNDGTASVNFPDPPEPYELPVASASNLGGIKKGTGLTIGNDGTASVNFPPPEPYELPVASDTTLGGIKQGDGLTIGSDGTTSVNFPDPPEPSEHKNLGTRIRYSDLKKVVFCSGVVVFDGKILADQNSGVFIAVGNNHTILYSRNGYSWEHFRADFSSSLLPSIVGVCKCANTLVFASQSYDKVEDGAKKGVILSFGDENKDFYQYWKCNDLISHWNTALAVMSNKNDFLYVNKLFTKTYDDSSWTQLDVFDSLLPSPGYRCTKLFLKWYHPAEFLFAVFSRQNSSRILMSTGSNLSTYTFEIVIQKIDDQIVDVCSPPDTEEESGRYVILRQDPYVYFLGRSGKIYTLDIREITNGIRKVNIYNGYNGVVFNSMIADIDNKTGFKLNVYTIVGSKGAMLYKETTDSVHDAFKCRRSRNYWLPQITTESFRSICVGFDADNTRYAGFVDTPTKKKVYVAVGDCGQIARSAGSEDFVLVNESSINKNNFYIEFGRFVKIIYDKYKNRYIAAGKFWIAVSDDCANWNFVLDMRKYLVKNSEYITNLVATPYSLLIFTRSKLFITTDLQTCTQYQVGNSGDTLYNCVFFRTVSRVNPNDFNYREKYFLSVETRDSTGKISILSIYSSDDGKNWNKDLERTLTYTTYSEYNPILLSANNHNCYALVPAIDSNQVKTQELYVWTPNGWQLKTTIGNNVISQHGFCKAFLVLYSKREEKIIAAFNARTIYLSHSGSTFYRLSDKKFNVYMSGTIREIVNKGQYIAMRSVEKQDGSSHDLFYNQGIVILLHMNFEETDEHNNRNGVDLLYTEGYNGDGNHWTGAPIGLIEGKNPFVAYGKRIIYLKSPRKSKETYPVPTKETYLVPA